MNKKLNIFIYYFIIFFLFISIDRLILLFKINDQKIIVNNIKKYENEDLKNEINELTHIDYNDYNYILGKITIKKIYNNNTFYINTPMAISDNLAVINNLGFIGLYSNHFLITPNNLNLSIKINDINGVLKDGKISIIKSNYNVGDKIYTSGLTNIPTNLLIGTVKDVYESSNEIEDIIEINFIENTSTYVGILLNYA